MDNKIVQLIQAENSGVFVLPDEYKDYKITDVMYDGQLFPRNKWKLLDGGDGIILTCRFIQGTLVEACIQKD